MELIKTLIAEHEAKQREIVIDPFEAAEAEAQRLGLLPEAADGSAEEAKKIASYWKAKAAKMTDSELRTSIGNDLEQLDYAPEKVASLITKIMRMVKS